MYPEPSLNDCGADWNIVEDMDGNEYCNCRICRQNRQEEDYDYCGDDGY